MTPSAMLAALPVDVFIVFAVFCRVGALFMTAPAFGDFSLSPRLRLAAALAVALVFAPVAAKHYPAWAASGDTLSMAAIVFGEILAGAFLGLAARVMMSALNVAGQIIALQMGLSLAQIFDPTQQLQGAIVGGFLAVLGATMIFASDLHHLLLAALSDSYALMAPGVPPSFGDMAEAMISTLSAAFSLGLRLAAPFVLFGLVFYIGAGVLNRLMPQAQVFFMLMPANLAIGLMLLMLTTGLMMSVFLGAFEEFLAQFLR
ncbi:MAG: flagellar biosynthetic protein FliR [Pseudomonadota bacterium]|nr:flagellar biosynthetic protein FliR [Pseudomonadota bacterium]